MNDQRFDDMIKVVAERSPTRRKIAAGVLAALLAAPVTDAATSKRGGKRGKKGKGKGPGNKPARPRPPHMGPPPGPGEDDCEQFFSGSQLERDCKEIRRTCRAPEHLCLHAIDSSGDDDRGVSCCPEHKTCCFFGCTDIRNDTKNCGPCGNECRLEETCRNGECVCDDARCLPGGSCCGEACCGGPNFPNHRCCDGQCLDTGRDRGNCGQCGNTCGAGKYCRDGQCACNDAACPHGQRCIKNDQYYCNGDTDPGCVCGCGTGYKYCKNLFGGVCVSLGVPDC